MSAMFENNYLPENPSHARIGYDDVITSVSATSAASGFPASSAQSWATYERWKPNESPATYTATFDETTVDYIGIGAHTLSRTDGVTFEVQVGGAWEEIEPGVIEGMESADNEAIMLLFESRLATGIRVTFTYAGNAPTIGKIAAGEVLVMQRPFYGGHSPAALSRDTRKQPSVSEGGEWLGASIIRQGKSTRAAWDHLKAAWYRAFFDPFVVHARRYPFFFAWCPLRFTDCVYAMMNDDVSPSNMGIRDLMSVSIGIKGYSDGTQARVTGFPAIWEMFFPAATAEPDIIDLAINREWPLA